MYLLVMLAKRCRSAKRQVRDAHRRHLPADIIAWREGAASEAWNSFQIAKALYNKRNK